MDKTGGCGWQEDGSDAEDVRADGLEHVVDFMGTRFGRLPIQ